MANSNSLKEWTFHFIKHKDVFEKKIRSLKDTEEGYAAEYPDRTQEYIVGEKFSLPAKSLAQGKSGTQPAMLTTIVCSNTRENVKAVVKDWGKLKETHGLTILFVNTETGEKWLLNPRVHDMIADSSSLETGLMKMMDTANGIVEKEDKKKRKKAASMFEESEDDYEEAEEGN